MQSLSTGSSYSGDLELVAIADGEVMLSNWLGREGWHGQAPLPAPASYPGGRYTALTVARHGDDLEVVGLGTDGNLYAVCYLTRDDGWKGGVRVASPPPGAVTALTTGTSYHGDLEVIGLVDGIPYLLTYLNGGGWNGSSPLPAPAAYPGGRYTALTVARHGDDLEVVGLGNDGSLYVVCYLTRDDGWQGGGRVASPPAGAVTALTTGTGYHGDLQVVGLVDGVPYLLAYLNGGGWNGSSPLPVPAAYPGGRYTALTVARHGDDLEVVGLGTDGNLYVVCYLTRDDGWQGGGRIASPPTGTVTALTTGTSESGDLEVVGLIGGAPYLLAYLNGDGWQEGMSLDFDPVQSAFANIPADGTQTHEFSHSDTQGLASHIQGMTRYGPDYIIFSHNDAWDYGYLLIGRLSDGSSRTFTVEITGRTNDEDDGKYYHPGGLQAFRQYLVVGVEPRESDNNYSKVVFYDLSAVASGGDPILLPTPTFPRDGLGAACCGLARVGDTYILGVYSSVGCVVDIYTATGPLESASFGQIISIKLDAGFDNLALTANDDGQVYLFGITSTGDAPFDVFRDYVHLFNIDYENKTYTKLMVRHFTTHSTGGEIGVHFRYGAGITPSKYPVDRSTWLSLYASARHFELTKTPLNFFGPKDL